MSFFHSISITFIKFLKFWYLKNKAYDCIKSHPLSLGQGKNFTWKVL